MERKTRYTRYTYRGVALIEIRTTLPDGTWDSTIFSADSSATAIEQHKQKHREWVRNRFRFTE